MFHVRRINPRYARSLDCDPKCTRYLAYVPSPWSMLQDISAQGKTRTQPHHPNGSRTSRAWDLLPIPKHRSIIPNFPPSPRHRHIATLSRTQTRILQTSLLITLQSILLFSSLTLCFCPRCTPIGALLSSKKTAHNPLLTHTKLILSLYFLFIRPMYVQTDLRSLFQGKVTTAVALSFHTYYVSPPKCLLFFGSSSDNRSARNLCVRR